MRTTSMSLALQCNLTLNKVSLSWAMTGRCKRQLKVENFMWSMKGKLWRWGRWLHLDRQRLRWESITSAMFPIEVGVHIASEDVVELKHIKGRKGMKWQRVGKGLWFTSTTSTLGQGKMTHFHCLRCWMKLQKECSHWLCHAKVWNISIGWLQWWSWWDAWDCKMLSSRVTLSGLWWRFEKAFKINFLELGLKMLWKESQRATGQLKQPLAGCRAKLVLWRAAWRITMASRSLHDILCFVGWLTTLGLSYPDFWEALMAERPLNVQLVGPGAFAFQNLVNAFSINHFEENVTRRRLNLDLNLGFILESRKEQLWGGSELPPGQWEHGQSRDCRKRRNGRRNCWRRWLDCRGSFVLQLPKMRKHKDFPLRSPCPR